MASGLFTRLASLPLVLHFVSIVVTVGYSDIAIKGVGLVLVTFSIFLHGLDKWSLDKRIKGKQPG